MSSENKNLGRLERVLVRDVWATEAGDFTPWLAGEDNIALLGDTIGLDLEVEAQEKEVGPFRADILCKETATGQWVLIENQLERTDHTHLGQLMTYAAGLHAVTIVWIADRFTDEHQATLNWLNDITSEEFNFFGLEVELWRIGQSPIAPKFNVISKPNDWTKIVNRAAGNLQTAGLTAAKALQLEYWQAFMALIEERGGSVRATKPPAQHWCTFSVGRSYFHIAAVVNTRETRIGMQLIMTGPNAKPHFSLLSDQRRAIEEEIGEPLRWREMLDKKESQIELRREGTDPTDRAGWAAQHEWLYEKLQAFHRAFSRRVKALNAEDYEGAVTGE